MPDTPPNPNTTQNMAAGLFSATAGKKLPAAAGRRKTVDRREPSLESPSDLESDRRKPDDRRQSVKKNAGQESTKTATDRIAEQNALKLAQHKRKRLLAECEAVMSVSYDILAMDDYPENALVAAARRDRDLWLFVTACMALVFLLGLPGFVPGWMAGSALGLSFLSWIFAFSPMRTHFFSRPTLRELLQTRQQIEFRALSHIRFLEANRGLAWRCRAMFQYNSNLNRRLFHGVVRFSAENNLLNMLKSRKHIRLYLLFALEAQKAYQIMQQTYLKLHFNNLEQGWDDGITDAEAEQLSQENNNNPDVQK